MSIKEYILQRFRTFGIKMSEADLLEVCMYANMSGEDEMNQGCHARVSIAIAKFIPSLSLRATSVGESGFSMSWDIKGIKDYYSFLCRRYGLKDEWNTDKPKVRSL